MKYTGRAILGWVVLLVTTVAYELWTIFDGNPGTPPLTDVIAEFVPGWLTFMGIGWLIWHFGQRYHKEE